MAAPASQEKILKEKVQQVLRLVPGAGKDKIVIVLEYYDQDVEETVSAFKLDGAKKALEEWNFQDTKPSAAKKKNKKKNANKSDTHDGAAVPNGVQTSGNGIAAVPTNGEGGPHEKVRRVSLSKDRPKDDYQQQVSKREARIRTLSEVSAASSSGGTAGGATGDRGAKSPHAGLEKSCRDLGRQTVSLQRLKVVLNEHVDASFKRVTEVFKELHNQLNEREAEVIFELDRVKHQANAVLQDQQKRAAELKQRTDRAQVMSERDVGLLRVDIKQFVGDRKQYEDLSGSQRFTCDFAHILEEVKKFGVVTPIKLSSERRQSIVSQDSSLSRDEAPPTSVAPPSTASISAATHRPAAVVRPAVQKSGGFVAPPSQVVIAPPIVSPAVFAPCAPPTHLNNARVLTQSDSLTQYETMAVQQRLAKLQIEGDEPTTSHVTFAAPLSGRSEGARGGRRGQGRGQGRGGSQGRNDNRNAAGDSRKPSSDRSDGAPAPAVGDQLPRGGRGGGRGGRGGRGGGGEGGQGGSGEGGRGRGGSGRGRGSETGRSGGPKEDDAPRSGEMKPAEGDNRPSSSENADRPPQSPGASSTEVSPRDQRSSSRGSPRGGRAPPSNGPAVKLGEKSERKSPSATRKVNGGGPGAAAATEPASGSVGEGAEAQALPQRVPRGGGGGNKLGGRARDGSADLEPGHAVQYTPEPPVAVVG